MSLSKVGEFIERRMRELRIQSVKELARRSGIPSNTLVRIRAHDVAMQKKNVDKLANALECEPHVIQALVPESRRGYTRNRADVPLKFQKRQTLCWRCQNAVPDGPFGCSWSERLEPVDGWEAIETTANRYDGGALRKVKSALVLDCPEFIPDEEAVNE